MKFKEEIPANCKQIIYNVNNIFFQNNVEFNENLVSSPIKNINDRTWNALRLINDSSSYIFSIILDHIEGHPQEWDVFLEKDETLIDGNFEVFDEELSSTINPFNKFLFFSIIKPHLSDSIIKCIIKDIIKTQEVSYIDDNGETKYKKYNIEYIKNIEDLFFENMAKVKKPIMIFDNGNGEILYYHEIQDFYMPKLKEIISEKNAKQESPVNEAISLREIIPSKVELTNNELDIIHGAMRNGGVIFIRNCYMVKESLIKLFDEMKEENAVINEYFKLILLVDNKNLIPKNFYSRCNIINRDLTILTEMKEYIIDLISSTPVSLFNRFMNNEANNSSAYYMKKLYVYFTIVIVVLVQYSNLKSRMFKVPIAFQRKDYFSILAYLYKYMISISEDKQKELANPDNFYGFTYESLIKIISDVFISARMLTKEEFENMNDFLLQIYENSFFLQDQCLFAYDELVLMNIDEKKYPVGPVNITDEIENKNNSSNNNLIFSQSSNNINNTGKYLIPKSALIEEFESIPNEHYFCLMYGISNRMLEEKKQKYINQFFNVICINNITDNINKNDSKIDQTTINKNLKVNINTVLEKLKDLKQNLPDLLNTTEANQALFKINKYNELFNPLDEVLQVEIDHFNDFITNLENDINCLLNVIKGDMILIEKYHDMLKCINKNIIPKEWHLSKSNSNKKEIKIEDWMKKIKKIYDFLNNWIYEGYSKIYDLSLINNERLFMTLLPIYFQKKLSDAKISSDKVKLHFKLTKYEKEEEITDDVLNEMKKANNNNEFIFIKGLKLKGFEGHKEEDREIKTYKENENNSEKYELLPIIFIGYIVEDYQYEIANQNNENEEEEEEDEEEEVQINQDVKEENKNESPKPSGSGPKDDTDDLDEEKKQEENNEENNNINNNNNEIDENNNQMNNNEEQNEEKDEKEERENEIKMDDNNNDNEKKMKENENEEKDDIEKEDLGGNGINQEDNIENLNEKKEEKEENLDNNNLDKEEKDENNKNETDINEGEVSQKEETSNKKEENNKGNDLEEENKDKEEQKKINDEKEQNIENKNSSPNEEEKKEEEKVENNDTKNNENKGEENKDNKKEENIEEENKITIEQKIIKSKKEGLLESISLPKSKALKQLKDEKGNFKIIKTKVRYYKKHCKLEIPFVEQQDPNTYNINDPYGFIELRFDCDKDKQEEYFQNKQLIIELDK